MYIDMISFYNMCIFHQYILYPLVDFVNVDIHIMYTYMKHAPWIPMVFLYIYQQQNFYRGTAVPRVQL